MNPGGFPFAESICLGIPLVDDYGIAVWVGESRRPRRPGLARLKRSVGDILTRWLG